MFHKIYLIIKETFSNRIISIVVLLSVICSALIVGIFDVAGDNINRYIEERFATSIPPNTIKVSPREARILAYFKTGERKTGITDKTIYTIRQFKGVNAVHPLLPVDVPMQAGIDFFGSGFRTDIITMGVPFSLVKNGIKDRFYRELWNRSKSGMLIPTVIPKTALQAYNDGMAEPNGLPYMSEKNATGIKFNLTFGHSSIRTLNGHTTEPAVIAGISDRPSIIALLVPLEIAREYNSKFHEGYRAEYLYLYVNVADHKSLLSVTEKITRMGFSVEHGSDLSHTIIVLKRNISLAILFIKYLVVFLSIIAVAFSTIIATVNRIDYYRVIRIVGGSKLFIIITILMKHIFIGMIGAFVALEMVQWCSVSLAAALRLSGMITSFALTAGERSFILVYCVILPVASTLPSLVKLNSKALSSD